jgi:hypothetical protein
MDSVKCTYNRLEDGRILLKASNFTIDIESFFELRVPGFNSPRSTSPSKSFVFTSYNSQGKVLDT